MPDLCFAHSFGPSLFHQALDPFICMVVIVGLADTGLWSNNGVDVIKMDDLMPLLLLLGAPSRTVD